MDLRAELAIPANLTAMGVKTADLDDADRHGAGRPVLRWQPGGNDPLKHPRAVRRLHVTPQFPPACGAAQMIEHDRWRGGGADHRLAAGARRARRGAGGTGGARDGRQLWQCRHHCRLRGDAGWHAVRAEVAAFAAVQPQFAAGDPAGCHPVTGAVAGPFPARIAAGTRAGQRRRHCNAGGRCSAALDRACGRDWRDGPAAAARGALCL
jgi:hypothetical protein